MEYGDRFAFGQKFCWMTREGAWMTEQDGLVWVCPPSQESPYWWIRGTDGKNYQQYTGNVAEWQAFHDAAALVKRILAEKAA